MNPLHLKTSQKNGVAKNQSPSGIVKGLLAGKLYHAYLESQ